MMQAGTYYVGDLCYVMHGEWSEFCDMTKEITEGEFQLKDGRKFASYNTLYGDGEFDGLCVDAGLIGCIKLEDIDHTNPDNHLELGRIVTFDRPFVTGSEYGCIQFGDVYIDTGDVDNNYE